MDTPENIWIIDTTLRDGAQSPGVCFRPEQRILIAKMLAGAGVNELEAGIPIMGPDAMRDLMVINSLNLRSRITGWCRATKADIEAAERCGLNSIHISFPVSERQLNVFNKERGWVFDTLDVLIPFACKRFPYVSIGAQDTTRCNEDFLIKFVRLAKENGAYRIRLADTVGVSTPSNIYKLVSGIKASCDIEIEFHGHNDLGMASANALTAIEAGAGAISVTVNGLGERSGNVPFEQIAVILHLSDKFTTSIDAGHIMNICNYVANTTNRPIPPDRPVTGANIFLHESGIHCAGLIKDPLSYQPYLPDAVGRKDFGFLLGRQSGSRAIMHMLGKAGIDITRDEAIRLKEVLYGKEG
ncbi:MAG: homocitrate synthase [Deltaproteobacteria bacterium]|nr:homocitrate synthase [Deltaproteobacteria bacterium]